jgi:hypothetical protein
MYTKDDVITYLLDRGGDISINKVYGYPVIRIQIDDHGYIFHMVNSLNNSLFVRDTFDAITGEYEREDIFTYCNLEEIGIGTILQYFHN